MQVRASSVSLGNPPFGPAGSTRVNQLVTLTRALAHKTLDGSHVYEVAAIHIMTRGHPHAGRRAQAFQICVRVKDRKIHTLHLSQSPRLVRRYTQQPKFSATLSQWDCSALTLSRLPTVQRLRSSNTQCYANHAVLLQNRTVLDTLQYIL